MIVACPECMERYELRDPSIQRSGKGLRCPTCTDSYPQKHRAPAALQQTAEPRASTSRGPVDARRVAADAVDGLLERMTADSPSRDAGRSQAEARWRRLVRDPRSVIPWIMGGGLILLLLVLIDLLRLAAAAPPLR